MIKFIIHITKLIIKDFKSVIRLYKPFPSGIINFITYYGFLFNKIKMENEKISIGKSGIVSLSLPDKDYKSVRKLGIIKDRIFYTTRKENQLFRKNNSFGINYKLLNEYGNYFDSICIEYEGRYYFTSRLYFLRYGEYLYFKDNGLEKQLFLPRDKFGKDKSDKFEIEQAERLINKVSQLGEAYGNLRYNLLQEELF